MASRMDAPPQSAAEVMFAANPSLRMLAAALRAVQSASPRAAAWAAQSVISTPPPKVVGRRPIPGEFALERWPFEKGSLALYFPKAAAQGGKVVILTHGWGGQGLQWLDLSQRLVRAGMVPVMLDLPAHGRSGGWRATLPCFTRALGYVTERLNAQALVAHSLGAPAAALVSMAAPSVERLVLAAPMGSLQKYTFQFASLFGLKESVRAEMQHRIEWHRAMLMSQFEASTLARRLTCPTLVVHDQGDKMNPVEDGRLYATASGARMIETAGLGHKRLLRDPAIVEAVTHFLGEAPQPSRGQPS